MPVTIELTPDIEAGLSARARERGLSLDAFIAGLLRTAAASETEDAGPVVAAPRKGGKQPAAAKRAKVAESSEEDN